MKPLSKLALICAAILLPSAAFAGCASMSSKGNGTGYWEVVNTCSYPIIGRFCYEGDSGPFRCNTWGGFGPLKPGAREMISPPQKKGSTRWKTESCNYDDWNKSTCRF